MNIVTMSANVSPFVVLRPPDKSASLQLRRHHQFTIQTRGEPPSSRRNILVSGGSLFAILTLSCCVYMPSSIALGAGNNNSKEEEDDKGVVGAIESLFDPNEKTKSGKILPKAYLKSAREVVKTLRESLKEDPKDNAKFRRTADAAKESIRDYLGNWRGQSKLATEESYIMLERAIRCLAGFYSKAGPSAPIPEDVKSEILDDLSSAEEFL